ncbi:MAG: hypothetical protein HQL41_04985 [Alphaproteobacteria bacterium]|nr:hypothetical protein [Alphaproteobacteria bacterium]
MIVACQGHADGGRDQVGIEPLRNVIARVQDEVRGYIPDDVDLVKDLSAQRRNEAADE